LRRLADLPPVFKRADELGACIDVAVFEDCNGTISEIIEAIPEAIPSTKWYTPDFHPQALEQHGYVEIDRKTFLGDWYDVSRRCLILRGQWTLDSGRTLEDPTYPELYGVKRRAGMAPLAEGRGQFAYAFSQTPYKTPVSAEFHAAFDEILEFILPSDAENRILDWGGPHLPAVSNYFEAGAEWWGTFLFSIYTPELRRLCVIAASTTD
jgi:hypothetical protein